MVDDESASDKEVKDGVNLDRILVEEIGQFGRYQLKAILLCAMVNIFLGYSEYEYIYTTAKLRTRCMIPECQNEETFAASWILNAIPSTGDSFDSCARFANSSISRNVTRDSTCPQHMFDRGSIVGCDSYVYENRNSAVYEFDLACDEWRRTLIGSVTILGLLLGLPITGFFSDRYGRRLAMAITSLNFAWVGVAKYWANSYEVFVLGTFIENFLGACSGTCAFILALEFVGPKHRVAVGTFMLSCLPVGTIFQALVMCAQPYWRHFILIINVPQLVTIVYFWMAPESVRWLISKRRFEKAKTILMQAAKTNGKELSERTLKSFEEEEKRQYDSNDKDAQPWLITIVFQHKPILLRCLVTPVWWISTLLVYFGLTVASVDVSDNKYLNYMAVNAVEIPGFLIGYWLMNRFGRKPVTIGGFWICSACQIAYIFIPIGYYAASLTVYLIGKTCISAVLSAIYVYTSELYPTQYRASLFCFSSMVGRLGALVGPLTPALSAAVWEHFPFVLFGCMAFISGLLVFLAPETLGTVLPDTMEEAAELGKHRQKDTKTQFGFGNKKSYNLN